ncbi:unnamed protein product [Rotaria sp. Silwood2]|nr:unnamed protein product [Rotaria sp. Silwood2]
MDDIETNCEKLYRNHAPQDEPQSYPLDPNHTHFILLDDKWGEDDEKWQRNKCNVRADLTIQLRAEIEQEARCSSHYRQNYKIPIVQILIEGGPSSLLTVIEAVTHETPVVVIEDAQLDSALIHAIQLDSVQFVELLIEQGASFDRLRRLINLDDLYKKKSGLPLLDQETLHTGNNKQQMYYKQYLNTEAPKITKSLEVK